jgi:PTH1 family peptidyl-tRNA hydrolase
MKIIIGLGNPGKQYEDTRHNVGFMLLDRLRECWGFSGFSTNKKFDAEVSEGSVGGHKVLLAKPQTFMNLSGISVRKLLDFYKLAPEDILVIQDELDLPLGKYRVATDSSSAGHNGIKDIIARLDTQKFARLRIGIAAPGQNASCPHGAHDFVLGRFARDESKALEDLFPALLSETERLVAAGRSE